VWGRARERERVTEGSESRASRKEDATRLAARRAAAPRRILLRFEEPAAEGAGARSVEFDARSSGLGVEGAGARSVEFDARSSGLGGFTAGGGGAGRTSTGADGAML